MNSCLRVQVHCFLDHSFSFSFPCMLTLLLCTIASVFITTAARHLCHLNINMFFGHFQKIDSVFLERTVQPVFIPTSLKVPLGRKKPLGWEFFKKLKQVQLPTMQHLELTNIYWILWNGHSLVRFKQHPSILTSTLHWLFLSLYYNNIAVSEFRLQLVKSLVHLIH